MTRPTPQQIKEARDVLRLFLDDEQPSYAAFKTATATLLAATEPPTDKERDCFVEQNVYTKEGCFIGIRSNLGTPEDK
jgi:hypothetical protein